MALISKTFYSAQDLGRHLKAHHPGLYFSSRTSTVIPYDKLEDLLSWQGPGDFYLCDLSKLPYHLELKENGNLLLRGAASWEETKKFLRPKGRNLKTSPTEQLALITAGIATSCTGERCFGLGTMRSQVVALKYLDYNGEEKSLRREDSFTSSSPFLKDYQQDYSAYRDFKNAPFPRFESAIDLMIGTEGQLGIVTEVEIETTPDIPMTYVFMLLPRWEENMEPHLEIYRAVQNHRETILSCEILDANCMSYLKAEEKLGNNEDVIFLEVKTEAFEDIYAKVLCGLTYTHADKVFEITESKFHHVRAGVPRAIFERNSRMGVVKVGTDVQVRAENFTDLFKFYRKATKVGVDYCLFGHFGDAHLHFNYMPTKDEIGKCLDKLLELYDLVYEWKGSPFAEHGIGLIKQNYIKRFHGKNQLGLFRNLKSEHDPYNQFFPQGFMTAKR